jgi:hypothetical protein
MQIKLIYPITGSSVVYEGGEAIYRSWPAPGEPFELGDDEANVLIANGQAMPVNVDLNDIDQVTREMQKGATAVLDATAKAIDAESKASAAAFGKVGSDKTTKKA